jgi:2-methylisocitrate lyase-like PEP mutase family enzyme
VDLQDGYGDRIREAVSRAVALGASGGNIEDFIPGASYTDGADKALYPLEVQVARLKEVFEAAPDFVLNARCDVFKLEPPPADDDEETMREAVVRGRAYLEAGATTVFYWGGSRGLRTSEVERLVRELDGRVAVKLRPVNGDMSVAELAKVGVARISVGPSLYLMGIESLKDGAKRILEGGHLLA